MDHSFVHLSTDPSPPHPPPQYQLPPQLQPQPQPQPQQQPQQQQQPSLPLHPLLPPLTTTTAPAPIANPTPSLNHNTHPPYTEMINSAITALKEKDGSSKRAISKYIEKVYGNLLPPNHSALLTHHLKRLKNTGQLIMVKKSYKLPRSDDANPPENNITTTAPVNAAAATTTISAHGPKPGRGRGRPPKSNSDTVLVSLGLVDKPKRGPGRPKKTDGGVVVGQRGPQKGRGRPPKAKKRGPGRPKKPKSVAGRLGPGRPPKVQVQAQDQLNPVAVSYVTSDTNVPVTVTMSRPRGRPKKIGTGMSGTTTSGKQQGRQPKKAVNSTGRPVGRPKKNASGALTETAAAQAAAIGDLKKKLEIFQTKIRQAVGVLKPQLSSESQISAVAAIQELEGLALMDITAPLKDDTQVTQPTPQPPPPQPQPQLQSQPQQPPVHQT